MPKRRNPKEHVLSAHHMEYLTTYNKKSAWWFQKFFVFTPNFGEDEHMFD